MAAAPTCVPLSLSGFRRFLERAFCSFCTLATEVGTTQRTEDRVGLCGCWETPRTASDLARRPVQHLLHRAAQGSRLSFSRRELSASNSNSSPTPPEPLFQEQGRSRYPVPLRPRSACRRSGAHSLGAVGGLHPSIRATPWFPVASLIRIIIIQIMARDS
ncbi:hypothetical protein VTN02DRAFT_857 [Thermoascus thermophilus]